MRPACLLGAAALAAPWGPGLTSIGPLRRRVMPELAGIAWSADVALSYDDGPDPKSTPQFLDLLTLVEGPMEHISLSTRTDFPIRHQLSAVTSTGCPGTGLVRAT